MEQRQPRLGDVVDDYCPRERRVTNHAVVAMVGDEVKQTRCTTCEADHEYKHARVPPQRKKKDVPGALYQQVLDGIPRVVPTPEPDPDGDQAAMADAEPEPEPVAVAAGAEGEHEGPVHRRLIRATLPRLPGAEAPVRREPDFTIRTPPTRPGKPKGGFRGGGFRSAGPPGGGAQGQPNGNRAGRRQGRPGGDPQGGAWNRSGQPGGRGPAAERQGRGGKKRSR
jgi:hypothetical protein